ncbi:SLOG cluster 4 domain-containing protein [Kamptonema formosum]|uniref:SLOG cluster 4 domain-containing protein n=1 Tax=Kamptonema formosum TaxID=331992 RepID=UPI0003459534|nr:LOG family protein [Oscillatoria sp. PCC 10802]
MKKIVIGVMGPGAGATAADMQNAFEIGLLIAKSGWVLLTGGRDAGVMDAAYIGAKEANGLTVGILPTDGTGMISPAVDIAIFTGMGSARNNINVLSSDVLVACGMGAGTASEIALAIKANKKVVLLNDDESSQVFFKKLSPENVFVVGSPEEAIGKVREVLG